MAETLSVRASEELQAKFKEFSEKSGFRNQGEFVSHLLTLYAAQETGIRVPSLEGAISAIRDMADKVCRILVGTGSVDKKITAENGGIISFVHLVKAIS